MKLTNPPNGVTALGVSVSLVLAFPKRVVTKVGIVLFLSCRSGSWIEPILLQILGTERLFSNSAFRVKTAAELVKFTRESGVEVLDGSWEYYSREMVEAAQAAGAKVWPDIQDGHEDA